jgi:hypothetical protein
MMPAAPRAPRLALLRALAVVQAAVLPALGVPMYFRNEAGWHYLLWQRTRFLDLFDGFLGPRSSMSNAVLSRPLVRILEWSQVRLFGPHATWYVVFNGGLFVGFALVLFQFALALFGASTAVLTVLLLMGGYQIVFYPVLNAIHGLQYPLEMLLCTAALLLFTRAFSGEPRRAIPAVFLSLLACVSHAASAVVIPLCVAALALGSRGPGRRHRIPIALLSPLGIALVFALERSGVPGGLASQPDVAAQLGFALRQTAELGKLILRPPGGPLLVLGVMLAAAAATSRPRVGVHVAAAAAAAFLWWVLRTLPLVAVPLLLVLAAAAVARIPARWFVVVWAGAGALLYIATPEVNASYARHFVVPLIVIAAEGCRVLLALCRSLPGFLQRLVVRLTVERAAAAATCTLVAMLAVATQARIPGLSSKLEQVRYVGDLGINFREALRAALAEVPPNGALGFFGGRSRDEEMSSFYGDDYFARLQPAKAEHYDDFTALAGRPDVRVVLVDPEAGPLPAAIPLLAVNAWEVERARRRCACEPVRRFTRRRSVAALYRIEGTSGSASP